MIVVIETNFLIEINYPYITPDQPHVQMCKDSRPGHHRGAAALWPWALLHCGWLHPPEVPGDQGHCLATWGNAWAHHPFNQPHDQSGTPCMFQVPLWWNPGSAPKKVNKGCLMIIWYNMLLFLRYICRRGLWFLKGFLLFYFLLYGVHYVIKFFEDLWMIKDQIICCNYLLQILRHDAHSSLIYQICKFLFLLFSDTYCNPLLWRFSHLMAETTYLPYLGNFVIKYIRGQFWRKSLLF